MPSRNSTLLLSGKDIADITNRLGVHALMDEMLRRLDHGFRTHSKEVCDVPVRSGFYYEIPRQGLVEWMPCYRRGKSVLMKMVGYHPQNPAACGLPTILSSLSLYDTSTGHLQAVADGNFLTALRTGAASALASRRMARRGSTHVGLIGAGAQAMSQLHALSRFFPIESVMLFDIDDGVSESFASRIEPLELGRFELQRLPVEEVVTRADILCVATSVGIGEGPVFPSGLVTTPHLHVNAVGSDLPGKTELPLEFLKRSIVVPDFGEQAAREGECQQLEPSDIGPELPTVLRDASLIPEVRDTVSVFDSTGFAIEDLIALETMLELAESLGVGTLMEIESSASDPHNPYEFLDVHERNSEASTHSRINVLAGTTP